MKNALLVGSLVTALLTGIPLGNAAEQQQSNSLQQAKEEGVPAMSMNPKMMMQRMMGMMQQGGLDAGMMRLCMVMMRTQVFIDSPSAIRAQAEALGLSDEQQKKLLDVENEARKGAKAILTEEQTKKMGEVPDKPMAMMEMCQQMAGKMTPMMQKMMGEGSQGGPMMMCPMMQTMMGGKGSPQNSETKQEK